MADTTLVKSSGGSPYKEVVIKYADMGDSTFAEAHAQTLFNETTSDKTRNNTQVQLQASGSYSSTFTSADLTNYNARGLHVILDATAVGTSTWTVTIKAKDPTSGKYYTLLAGAVINTISTNVYKVYPGLPATANVSANDVLPRTFQIVVTYGGSGAGTYSLAYSLVV